jgi:sirohydrochlorin cobaltochelatase
MSAHTFYKERAMNKVRLSWVILLCAVVAVGGLVSSCASTDGTAATGEKPVIVIAAFGSSYESGLKDLESFDTAVREAFPDHKVTWAFTASFIVDKLKEEGKDTIFARGVPVRTLREVYADLRKQGKRRVLVQSLHMMVGQEYRQAITAPTDGLNVKYSHSLLFYPENIQNVVNALEPQFGDPDDTVTILCAHGNEKHLEYNAELVRINNYLHENYDHTHLAVMEGIPQFGPVEKAVEDADVSKVQFVTFMLTYGDHMSNDVMGDGEDSMKSRLELPADCTGGLAGHSKVQDLFINNMKLVMDQFM